MGRKGSVCLRGLGQQLVEKSDLLEVRPIRMVEIGMVQKVDKHNKTGFGKVGPVKHLYFFVLFPMDNNVFIESYQNVKL